jgi:hypothetical protein
VRIRYRFLFARVEEAMLLLSEGLPALRDLSISRSAYVRRSTKTLPLPLSKDDISILTKTENSVVAKRVR